MKLVEATVAYIVLGVFGAAVGYLVYDFTNLFLNSLK